MKYDKMMHIGGNNFQFGQIRRNCEYYSFFSHDRGWASWKRASKYFEYDIGNPKKTIQENYIYQFK
jgi:hypothetical protein